MAHRTRRKEQAEDAGGTPALKRTTPQSCPVCERSLSGTTDEATTHLRSHAPQQACGNCGTQHTGWTLDWDGVMYPRKDVSLFYCSPCGRYAAVPVQG
jgi:hypothetical protein